MSAEGSPRERSAVVWGIGLGVAVVTQHWIFAALGWHTQPDKATLFLVFAVGMNIAAVSLVLRSRSTQSGWTGQLHTGLKLGVAAAAVIFVGSWLVTAVIYPEYFLEMAAGYGALYEQAGMPSEEMEEIVAGLAATTPVRSAVEGVVGTLVVSVAAAAVWALIFWRRSRLA